MSVPAVNRKINLLQATAINMIDMVGIGPFVVMPFVVAQFDSGLEKEEIKAVADNIPAFCKKVMKWWQPGRTIPT